MTENPYASPKENSGQETRLAEPSAYPPIDWRMVVVALVLMMAFAMFFSGVFMLALAAVEQANLESGSHTSAFKWTPGIANVLGGVWLAVAAVLFGRRHYWLGAAMCVLLVANFALIR